MTWYELCGFGIPSYVYTTHHVCVCVRVHVRCLCKYRTVANILYNIESSEPKYKCEYVQ